MLIMDVADEEMAFPMFKVIPNSGQHDSHQDFAWKVVLPGRTSKQKWLYLVFILLK